MYYRLAQWKEEAMQATEAPKLVRNCKKCQNPFFLTSTNSQREYCNLCCDGTRCSPTTLDYHSGDCMMRAYPHKLIVKDSPKIPEDALAGKVLKLANGDIIDYDQNGVGSRFCRRCLIQFSRKWTRGRPYCDKCEQVMEPPSWGFCPHCGKEQRPGWGFVGDLSCCGSYPNFTRERPPFLTPAPFNSGPQGVQGVCGDYEEGKKFAELLLQVTPTENGIIVPPSLDIEAVRDAINYFVRKISESLKVPKEYLMSGDGLHTQVSTPCQCCGGDGAKERYFDDGDFCQKLCDHCNLFCKEEGEHVYPSDLSRIQRRRQLKLGASRQEAIEAAQRTGELLDKYLKAKYGKQEPKTVILWKRLAIAAGVSTGLSGLSYLLFHLL